MRPRPQPHSGRGGWEDRSTRGGSEGPRGGVDPRHPSPAPVLAGSLLLAPPPAGGQGPEKQGRPSHPPGPLFGHQSKGVSVKPELLSEGLE